jgi:hypothetical protein
MALRCGCSLSASSQPPAVHLHTVFCTHHLLCGASNRAVQPVGSDSGRIMSHTSFMMRLLTCAHEANGWVGRSVRVSRPAAEQRCAKPERRQQNSGDARRCVPLFRCHNRAIAVK